MGVRGCGEVLLREEERSCGTGGDEGRIQEVSGPAPSGSMDREERLDWLVGVLLDTPWVGELVVASFSPFPYPWTRISQ